MNPLNKKALILSIPMILLVALFGGWLVFRGQKGAQESYKPPMVAEDPTQNPEDIQPSMDIDTSNWKTYRNEALKLSIKYPNVFKLDEKQREDGHVVSFMEFNQNARDLSNKPIPGYFSPITISYWKDINDSYLRGGKWVDQKKYKNFQDFIADSEHTYIRIISEINVDGAKAYTISMPGADAEYESIMFEYAGGYYRISFPWTQKPLDENIKKEFLSSIKLLK